MKKILFCLFSAVIAACFTSCIVNESEMIIESHSETYYVGAKKPGSPREVGDIVFNDGSATHYTSTLTLTDTQKQKAVAVIYKVDGSRYYGVGLAEANGKAWCTNTAKGYAKIENIVCTPSGTASNYTFDSNADTNGGNNLTQIGQAILSPAVDDDTGTAANYPAFYVAKDYKNVNGSHVSGTIYQNDWYLPSVSELYDVFSVKNSIIPAIELCEGSTLSNASYWSSSQVANANNSAYTLSFQNGEISYFSKTSTANFTRCIRQF